MAASRVPGADRARLNQLAAEEEELRRWLASLQHQQQLLLKRETDLRVRSPIDGVVINTARHEVSIEGRPVAFTATEFRLLHYLATNPGRVFTRNQLLGRAIGGSAAVVDRNIDVHIGAIRRKLGAHRGIIETVRGVGYRLQDRGTR